MCISLWTRFVALSRCWLVLGRTHMCGCMLSVVLLIGVGNHCLVQSDSLSLQSPWFDGLSTFLWLLLHTICEVKSGTWIEGQAAAFYTSCRHRWQDCRYLCRIPDILFLTNEIYRQAYYDGHHISGLYASCPSCRRPSPYPAQSPGGTLSPGRGACRCLGGAHARAPSHGAACPFRRVALLRRPLCADPCDYSAHKLTSDPPADELDYEV